MSLVPADEFPALARGGLTYLDSAATTLKPRCVIEAVTRALSEQAFSPHAGSPLAFRGHELREEARASVARFVGGRANEVAFVRGTTEALNLLAEGWARPRLGPRDTIVVTVAEHHANLLPWRRVADRTGARVVIAPLGHGMVPDVVSAIDERTRVVAVGHVSNVTGLTADLPAIVRAARAVDARVFVDGAQSFAHLPMSVDELGIDAYAASSHKAYGPSGLGVLWARPEILAAIEPRDLGGHAALRVDAGGFTLREAPARLEAGTPAFESALGLAAALAFLERIGRARLEEHTRRLTALTAAALAEVPGVKVVSAAGALVSFVVAGVHAHDVATVLGESGVMVRSGRLCAEPLLDALGVDAVVRASFAVHSSLRCVEALVAGVAAATELAA